MAQEKPTPEQLLLRRKALGTWNFIASATSGGQTLKYSGLAAGELLKSGQKKSDLQGFNKECEVGLKRAQLGLSRACQNLADPKFIGKDLLGREDKPYVDPRAFIEANRFVNENPELMEETLLTFIISSSAAQACQNAYKAADNSCDFSAGRELLEAQNYSPKDMESANNQAIGALGVAIQKCLYAELQNSNTKANRDDLKKGLSNMQKSFETLAASAESEDESGRSSQENEIGQVCRR